MMMKTPLVVVLLFFLFFSLKAERVESGFHVERASFTVSLPSKLKGKYDMAIANFGVPLYGATLVGSFKYPKTDQDGCAEFDANAFNTNSSYGANIMLLNRGECPFTTKAFFAQKAGAEAVIIVDNIAEDLITMDAADDAESQEYVKNISVPVALITESVGEKFEEELSAGNAVIATLNWTDVLPHPDSRVEYEIWTELTDSCGAKCDAQVGFLNDWAPIAKELETKNYTQFTPHYLTWSCPEGYEDSDVCLSECINHGRYCIPDPDDDLYSGYSGADVVVSNLRALCAFKAANDSQIPTKWWDYITEFQSSCKMSTGLFNSYDCAETSMKRAGLDTSSWKNCIGDIDANSENAMMEEQIIAQSPPSESTRSSVRILPTVVINDVQYRGKLARGEVLKAICAGFPNDLKPEMCSDSGLINDKCAQGADGWNTCLSDPNKSGETTCSTTSAFPYYECICPKGLHSEFSDSLNTWSCVSVQQTARSVGKTSTVLASVFFSLLVLVTCLFLFYRWKMKQVMNQEIRGILSQYMPLDDDEIEEEEDTARLNAGNDSSSIRLGRSGSPTAMFGVENGRGGGFNTSRGEFDHL
tara:strand:+ start:36 stop:1796 length:1761 start_codon:yes stop_codon:yes gene_type:complete